jgi:hypothetical protein
MEYTVNKKDDKTAELILIDPDSGIVTTRTINIFDCKNKAQLDERIEAHLRAFAHRINVGVITTSSLPAVDLPSDIVVDPTLSKASQLVLLDVIEAKTGEMLQQAEENLTKLIKEDEDEEAVIEAKEKIATIKTSVESIFAVKTETLALVEPVKEEVFVEPEVLNNTLPKTPVPPTTKPK